MNAVNKVSCKVLQGHAGTRQVIEQLPASAEHGRQRRPKNHRQWDVPMTVIILAVFTSVPSLAAPAPIPIRLGQSIVYLNGPWKFHTGDDAAWANPSFDDSTWESADLTAPPGAHDQDVGLSRYVSGWATRGHRGYSGYAWYRLRLAVAMPDNEPLALAGPPAVDSAYQVFVNGQLLGGLGRFSGKTPTVFSIQPCNFEIPRSLINSESTLIAFRVWMGPWELADPEAGGIRIAPALGETSSINMLYQAQWLETVRGYIVEVIEAAAFILLAVMVWTLAPFQPRQAYRWICVALVFTACLRANQAIFFWGQFESVHVAEIISVVLLPPLCLAAWTLAWRAWFGLDDTKWMLTTIGLLTVLYLGVRFFRTSLFYGIFSHGFVAAFGFTETWIRILFLVLTLLIVYRAIRQRERETWLALPAMILISIGQFAREVSVLGVPGIWFPFSTGVSRTQFAYAAFDAVFFALLLWRFRSQARIQAGASQPSEEVRATS